LQSTSFVACLAQRKYFSALLLHTKHLFSWTHCARIFFKSKVLRYFWDCVWSHLQKMHTIVRFNTHLKNIWHGERSQLLNLNDVLRVTSCV
jgi:hypothetical protein